MPVCRRYRNASSYPCNIPPHHFYHLSYKFCKMQAFGLLPLQAMQWFVNIYIHRTTSLSLAIIPIFHDKTDQRRDICTNSVHNDIQSVLWVLIGWSSYNHMHLSMWNTYTWYMTGTVHVHCTMVCHVYVWFCQHQRWEGVWTALFWCNVIF